MKKGTTNDGKLKTTRIHRVSASTRRNEIKVPRNDEEPRCASARIFSSWATQLEPIEWNRRAEIVNHFGMGATVRRSIL